MLGQFASHRWLLALALLFTNLAAADQPMAGDAEQLLVLRNGEVLQGHVTRRADRYVVAAAGSEIRVPARDVDFVCKSLDEAYELQRNQVIAGRIDDHLNLAAWCLRQELTGYAAREIGAAMQIDPRNARLVSLDRSLKREQELIQAKENPVVVARATADSPQLVSPEELERLVRCLPGNTVETFATTIQPMLLNGCATAGCHGPSPNSKYTLLRPAMGQLPQRRMTQRNLYNTLSWIDHANPAESKILAAARQPHGTHQSSTAAGLNAAHFQVLAAWVTQATQGVKMQAPQTLSINTANAELPIANANLLDSDPLGSSALPESSTAIAAKMAARKQKKPVASARVPSPAGGGMKPAAQPQTIELTPPAAAPAGN